jgi:hypothetical protein
MRPNGAAAKKKRAMSQIFRGNQRLDGTKIEPGLNGAADRFNAQIRI